MQIASDKRQRVAPLVKTVRRPRVACRVAPHDGNTLPPPPPPPSWQAFGELLSVPVLSSPLPPPTSRLLLPSQDSPYAAGYVEGANNGSGGAYTPGAVTVAQAQAESPAGVDPSTLPDCNQCRFCLDKKRNGGTGTLRRRCILKGEPERKRSANGGGGSAHGQPRKVSVAPNLASATADPHLNGTIVKYFNALHTCDRGAFDAMWPLARGGRSARRRPRARPAPELGRRRRAGRGGAAASREPRKPPPLRRPTGCVAPRRAQAPRGPPDRSLDARHHHCARRR